MKRIVVDARTIVKAPDGISFYTIYFVKRLVHSFHSRAEIDLILPAEREDLRIFSRQERQHLRVTFSRQEAFGENHEFDYDEWNELVASLAPDIFISTSYFSTTCDCPQMTIFHDLIPLLFADRFASREAGRPEMFKRLLADAAAHCELVVAVSQHTAKDLRRMLPNRRHKIKILHPDVEYTIESIERKLEDGVPAHGRFLMIGINRPRKNVELVLGALSHLKQQGISDCKVFLAGKPDEELVPIYDYIAEYDVENLVEVLGYVSDDEMYRLIHGSQAILYPSYYEGFGMPLVEAMVAHKPAICMPVASLPEVGGQIPFYCEDEPSEMAEIMLGIQNGTLRPRPGEMVDAQLRKLIMRNMAQYNDVFAWIAEKLQEPRRVVMPMLTQPSAPQQSAALPSD